MANWREFLGERHNNKKDHQHRQILLGHVDRSSLKPPTLLTSSPTEFGLEETPQTLEWMKALHRPICGWDFYLNDSSLKKRRT